MINCKQCGNDFIPSRADAIFCSESCRKKHSYSNSEPKQQQAPQAPMQTPLFGEQYFLTHLTNEKNKVENENKELKAEIKANEKKIKELEVFKATVDKERELETQKALYDKSQGFSGFMESDIGSELFGLVKEVIINQLNKKGSGNEFLSGVDEEEKELITTILGLIKDADKSFLSYLTLVVQKFVENPQALVLIYQRLTQKTEVGDTNQTNAQTDTNKANNPNNNFIDEQFIPY